VKCRVGVGIQDVGQDFSRLLVFLDISSSCFFQRVGGFGLGDRALSRRPAFKRSSREQTVTMAQKAQNGHAVDHMEADEKNGDFRPTEYVEDPALDRRITRKCDLHILPWIFALWLLAFIDRSNIGNARIDGLEDELKLTGNMFNVALTVFYILYVLLDIPSNWLLKYVGGGEVLAYLGHGKDASRPWKS